jgi:hypothetical protein
MSEASEKSISLDSSDAMTAPAMSFWSAIRESLRGSRQDYTVGPIGRSIILLAIPMVLEMCMESIFAVVDIKWVSYLGADAMATVGLTESMLTLMYAIAIGLSIGATATVARRIGEHNPDGAARAAVQSLVLGLTVSTVIAVVAAPLSPRLLAIMGASPAVVAHGWIFTTIMLGGNLTIMMLFMINAIFRGAGDAAIAMRVLWFANALNIILGPCFIFGLGRFPGWASPARRWRRILDAAPALSMHSAAWFAKADDLKSSDIISVLSRQSWAGLCVCQPQGRFRFSSAWRVGSAWCGRFRVLAQMLWPDT